jgi:hypothetical protein
MAYSEQERYKALNLLEYFMGRGTSVRLALFMVQIFTKIPYQTVRRWYYTIKDRPSTNPRMTEIGICHNMREAIKGRVGAIDLMIRLYRSHPDVSNEDRETLRMHYETQVILRKIELVQTIKQRHQEMGNQKKAVASVAEEFEFPYSFLWKLYLQLRDHV